MYLNYTHFPVPPISCSHPYSVSQWKLKKNQTKWNKASRQNKTITKKKSSLLFFLSFFSNTFHSPWWHLEWCVTQCTHLSFPLCQQMFITMSLVQGLWFLACHHHWTLTGNPLGYRAAAQSHWDPVGIVPHDHCFHKLQQALHETYTCYWNRVASTQMSLLRTGFVVEPKAEEGERGTQDEAVAWI